MRAVTVNWVVVARRYSPAGSFLGDRTLGVQHIQHDWFARVIVVGLLDHLSCISVYGKQCSQTNNTYRNEKGSSRKAGGFNFLNHPV